MDDDPEDVIRNIPASVLSDIKRIDDVIDMVTEMAGNSDSSLIWVDAEVILDSLHDVRSGLLYLAKKHDSLAVKLSEYENNE